jgi:hypothetical protein
VTRPRYTGERTRPSTWRSLISAAGSAGTAVAGVLCWTTGGTIATSIVACSGRLRANTDEADLPAIHEQGCLWQLNETAWIIRLLREGA